MIEVHPKVDLENLPHPFSTLIVAGNYPQAVFWAKEIGLAAGWTYASSPGFVRGRRQQVIIYAGRWSQQASALDIFEALRFAGEERYTCGDPWEDEQETYLYQLRLNLDLAKREALAAAEVFDEAEATFARERSHRGFFKLMESIK